LAGNYESACKDGDNGAFGSKGSGFKKRPNPVATQAIFSPAAARQAFRQKNGKQALD